MTLSAPATGKLRPSYLDYQATTPVDPRVLDAMLPFVMGNFGNPHSKSHAYGWSSEDAVEKARDSIYKFIAPFIIGWGFRKIKESTRDYGFTLMFFFFSFHIN